MKWGDYDDLTVLEGMHELRQLELRGASNLTDLHPLSTMTTLEQLSVEGFRQITHPAPIGRLTSLIHLELGGAWMTPRNAHVESISFLRSLPQLESLLLHTIIVDDSDYQPLLSLPNLRSVRVMATRGMNPTYEHLKKNLPWSG